VPNSTLRDRTGNEPGAQWLTAASYREILRIGENPVSMLPIIVATSLMISFTARAATYTISSYPAGLAEVSCDAFKKNADGSWTQVAILIAGGALIPAGSNFKNTAESRIIEKKCDKE
jgi:hypothetical protein